MKTKAILPNNLRSKEMFEIGQYWYLINKFGFPSKIQVSNIMDGSFSYCICGDIGNDKNDSSFTSSSILQPEELMWIQDFIKTIADKSIQNIFSTIIHQAKERNLDTIIFIEWLYKVQKKYRLEREQAQKFIKIFISTVQKVNIHI